MSIAEEEEEEEEVDGDCVGRVVETVEEVGDDREAEEEYNLSCSGRRKRCEDLCSPDGDLMEK